MQSKALYNSHNTYHIILWWILRLDCISTHETDPLCHGYLLIFNSIYTFNHQIGIFRISQLDPVTYHFIITTIILTIVIIIFIITIITIIIFLVSYSFITYGSYWQFIAHITSSPFFSKSSMFSLTELPPTNNPHLSDGWWSDSWVNTANIWPASSLVGATTRAPISCLRKGVSLLNSISKIGIPKAIVLPDPVVASTHTSCRIGWFNILLHGESLINLAESRNLDNARNEHVLQYDIIQSSDALRDKMQFKVCLEVSCRWV